MTNEEEENKNDHKREPLPTIKDIPTVLDFYNRIVKRFENGQLGHKELTALAFVADKATGALRLGADLEIAEIQKELELLRHLTGVQSRETAFAGLARAEAAAQQQT